METGGGRVPNECQEIRQFLEIMKKSGFFVFIFFFTLLDAVVGGSGEQSNDKKTMDETAEAHFLRRAGAQHTQDGTPRRGGIDLTDANRCQKAEAKGEEDGGGIERQERWGEERELRYKLIDSG